MTADTERTASQIQRVLDEADTPYDATTEEPLAPDTPPDRTRRFTHVNLSRMRTSWKPDERITMQEIRRQADNAVLDLFPEIYELLARIYIAVRIQESGDDGPLTNADGSPRWKLNKIGKPVEDWTRISDHDRDQWLHEIVVHLLEWWQRADALWMDAMFAKGIWEETFAAGYTGPAERRLTIDDRTQAGHLASMEERYFAIFQSALSRRAQSLVRSMERIDQRLKDTGKV